MPYWPPFTQRPRGSRRPGPAPYRPNWRNDPCPDQRQVKAYHGVEDDSHEETDGQPNNTPDEDVEGLHYGLDNQAKPSADTWEQGGLDPTEEDVIESDAHYVDTLRGVQCRRCKAQFPSNNTLHRHPRHGCTESEELLANKASVAQPSRQTSVPEIRSDATDLRLDGYGFRGWHYVTAMASLAADAAAESLCLDTGCTMTLVDREFLHTQAPIAKISRLPNAIAVRGVGSGGHHTDGYTVLDLPLPGTDANGTDVVAVLTCEAHIVNDLSAKMLIGMDILGPESILLDIPRRKAILYSCAKMAIPITVTPRGR